MKLLSIVPVLYDPVYTKMCLENIKSDLLVIDNNAEDTVKEVIEPYNKIVNDENIYVNPAWNQAIKYFLKSDYDSLALICSDVIMFPNWEDFVIKYFDNQIIIPNPVSELPVKSDFENYFIPVKSAPGIFILLDKKMAKIVYPIPEELKIWFGDQWIFDNLQMAGYEMRSYFDLFCVHGNSRSVSVLKEAPELIEQDKRIWDEIRHSIHRDQKQA